MADDALPKAGYEAFRKVMDSHQIWNIRLAERWETLLPEFQEAFRGFTCAALRAAGVEEKDALLHEFAEWVQAERNACPDVWVMEAEACTDSCPRWEECRLPKLSERIKAAIERATYEPVDERGRFSLTLVAYGIPFTCKVDPVALRLAPNPEDAIVAMARALVRKAMETAPEWVKGA